MSRNTTTHNYVTKRLPEALRIVQNGGYATAHPELTSAEKALVYHYTEDGYDALNAGLHGNPTAPLAAFGQGLAAVLSKLPPHVGRLLAE
ncbi:hypothetical protein [Hymenobacter rubripertinctus]|uniref:Uncharacterized protein n=1 Tax=Hymenobacter rubripertinctus TaxID=2029981 RepID=A0A418R794_9BACT|nr:hypothetical protein [Hymenobacter rubripertinctus]RIY13388.1 hypothetical protein D0T11_02835 [Hymenobacter rubripertinctus]